MFKKHLKKEVSYLTNLPWEKYPYSMKGLFTVIGMNCTLCKMHVEEAVRALPGVTRAEVDLLQNRLSVQYDDTQVSPAQLIAAVQKAGYDAYEVSSAPQIPTEETTLKKRFWLSISFLIPLMLIAMAHTEVVPAGLQVLLTAPILWFNRRFFVSGFKQIFKGTPTMDSLVAVGATAAVGQSGWALCVGRQGLYFESAAMIVTLVTLGKYLEARAKAKTTRALSALAQLLPSSVQVRRNGQEKTIPRGEVKLGDILIIRAGESVGADGEVVTGECSVNEAALTGESLPQEKQPGDWLCAGTLLESGYAEVLVAKIGTETIVAQLITLVEQATASKAPITRLADKISRVFVPVVLGVSALTFGVWYAAVGNVEQALSFAICVLVISCPCALGLATPTAVAVGMGVGAKRGILIKSAAILERVRHLTTVVLDKTGTVTTGEIHVAGLSPASGQDETNLLQAALSLEQASAHPFAKALVAYAKTKGLVAQPVAGFEQFPGLGVRAGALCGGNLKAMIQWHIPVPQGAEQIATAAAHGQTVLFFAQGEKYLGSVAFSDTLKPTSRQAVELLQKAGLRVHLLTGDNAQTARFVADQLGIEIVRAEVFPHEKQAYLRTLQAAGEVVAMVGDGINDAPSLACADVGIALGSATEVAADSADIILMQNDLREVAIALALSRAMLRNIEENLFWAFFYNILCIPLAAGVLYPHFGIALHPMMAAAAMSISSLCVVTNALRLNGFKPPFQEELCMQKVLEIQGMMCGHCAAHVERALNALPGVKAKVDLVQKIARIEAASPVDDSVLIETVKNAGYEVVAIH